MSMIIPPGSDFPRIALKPKKMEETEPRKSTVSYSEYTDNPSLGYQTHITSKIQEILNGKESITFDDLLANHSTIKEIYNSLADGSKEKQLFEYAISLDDGKSNVTEKELRNLYRLLDMSGGNLATSTYDGDIDGLSARQMLKDLARNFEEAQHKIQVAHTQTLTTKDMENPDGTQNELEGRQSGSKSLIDLMI